MMRAWSDDLDRIKKGACFVFDLDGTIYLGNRLLPGAKDLLSFLETHGIAYFFMTNNSSRSKSDYVHKLAGIGLPVPAEKIITSGEATAIYLQKNWPGAAIFLVGTPSLEEEFRRHDLYLVEDDPQVVVLGFDTTLTYEKIRKLCAFVAAGRSYIATHPDINCPTDDGFIPDIGSVIALVEASTGRVPDVIVGKPHAPIVEALIQRTGFAKDEIVVIGDRLYTDIALGETGVATVLVLSGETKFSDVEASDFRPDLIVQGVGELLDLLRTP